MQKRKIEKLSHGEVSNQPHKLPEWLKDFGIMSYTKFDCILASSLSLCYVCILAFYLPTRFSIFLGFQVTFPVREYSATFPVN